MSKPMRVNYLVCEGAYFRVEGATPAGVYGQDWLVIAAETGREAVRMYETCGAHASLSEDKARALFASVQS